MDKLKFSPQFLQNIAQTIGRGAQDVYQGTFKEPMGSNKTVTGQLFNKANSAISGGLHTLDQKTAPFLNKVRNVTGPLAENLLPSTYPLSNVPTVASKVLSRPDELNKKLASRAADPSKAATEDIMGIGGTTSIENVGAKATALETKVFENIAKSRAPKEISALLDTLTHLNLPDKVKQDLIPKLTNMTKSSQVKELVKYVSERSKEAIKIPAEVLNSQRGAEVYQELDNAAKGLKKFNDTEAFSQHSTFPDWVPENLRSRKLFDRVQKNLVDGTVPKSKSESELYAIVHEQMAGKVPDPVDLKNEINQVAEPFQVAYDSYTRKSIDPLSAKRGLLQSMQNSQQLSPQVKEGLANLPQGYDKVSRAISGAQGDELLAMGEDAVEAMIHEKDRELTSGLVDAAHTLQNRLSADGTPEGAERAIQLGHSLAKKFTTGGQAIEQGKVFSDLSPAGIITTVAKIINNAKEKVKVSPQRLASGAAALKSRFDQATLRAAQKLVAPKSLREMIGNIDRQLNIFDEGVDLASDPTVAKSVKKAVQTELRGRKEVVSKIIRTSVANQKTMVADISDALLSEGFSEDATKQLSKVISTHLNEKLATAKTKALEQLGKEYGKRAKQTFTDKIAKFSNLGALDDQDYIDLVSKKLGIPHLSRESSHKLSQLSQELQAIPEGIERHDKIKEITDLVHENIPTSLWDRAMSVANIPTGLITGLDVSAPFRQGFVLGSGNLKQFGEMIGNQLKLLGSENYARELQDSILKNPDKQWMDKFGIHIGSLDLSGKLSNKEEQFMSNIVSGIDLTGGLTKKGIRPYKASERAFTVSLDKMRADVFSVRMKELRQLGFDPANPADEKVFQMTADFINAASGRGDLGATLERAVPLLNAGFLSPRFLASRINVLKPVVYLNTPAPVRKEAMKTIAAFAAINMGFLATLKMAGAEVAVDPRNPEFGQAKILGQKFDLLAGFRPIVRFAAQVMTGQSESGGVVTAKNRGYTTARFVRSKNAPIMGVAMDMIYGKTFEEDTPTISNELASLVVPLYFKDLNDAYQENGVAGVAATLPAGIGVGVAADDQTSGSYGGTPSKPGQFKRVGSPSGYSGSVPKFKRVGQ